MARGPIPDKPSLVDEVRRLGFEPTGAQMRWLEMDPSSAYRKLGEDSGWRMQAAARAGRRIANLYGRVLCAALSPSRPRNSSAQDEHK